jgi:DAK2 domain fusion protein YloV
VADPSLVRFRAVVRRALAELEARREEVNDLNVFPVADGDTGDNMALTLRAVLDELDRLSGAGDIDEIGRDEIVDSVARAALLGARGNSGVILSQLIRGAAEELASRPGELVDPVLVGAAMTRASDRARGSVREPAEGTILTVVQDMAHRVSHELGHLPEPRLHHDDAERQDQLIAEVLEAAVAAGQESVRRGPDLLPILRQAGVVDAGGFGLTVILAGVVAALRGAEAPQLDHHAPARVTHPQHQSSTYRWCTNFAVTGEDLDASAWMRALEALGDSVLVVGDQRTLKVHLHTDEPDAAMALFADAGRVSRVDMADMHEQVQARVHRLGGAAATCGALAVVSSDGMAQLFAGEGATPLLGGPTMNPSTHELLAGIHHVPAEQVVVLPNSPNVIMAAERAAELSDKKVVVVPTRSQQAGLWVTVALQPDRDAEENGARLRDALADVHTGAVTEAARDDAEHRPARFRRGDAVGFVDEELVAWGEPAGTLSSVMGALAAEAGAITVIEGVGAPLDADAVAALAPGGVEFDAVEGGQPSYWWLIAAE